MGVGIAITSLICLVLFGVSVVRPQLGVIAVAGLLPFHGLLLIAPVSMDFWKEAAVLAVLSACPFARRVGRGRTVSAPWLVPLAVLVPLGAVSAFIAFGTQALFPMKIAFFYVILALVVVLFPFDRTDKDHFVSVLFGAGALSAVYGIWQQLIGPYRLADLGYEWNEQIRSAGPLLRSFGTFNQPFPFGLFLMLVIVFVAAAALAEPDRLRSRLFLVAFPVLATGVILSVVRAALLGTAVGLVIIGLLLYRRFLTGLAISVGIGLPLAGLVSAALGSPVLTTLTSSSSLQERGGHWSVNLPLVSSQPFGSGLGTTGSSAAKVFGGHNPSAPLYQPDSYYMKVLLEMGPLGMALYAAVAGVMVVGLLRMIPYTGDPLERGVLAGAVAVTLGACVAAFFSTYLEIFPLDAYFWLVPAIAGSTSVAVRDRVAGRRGAPRPGILRSGVTRSHTTRRTTSAILSRKATSEKSAANRASAHAG